MSLPPRAARLWPVLSSCLATTRRDPAAGSLSSEVKEAPWYSDEMKPAEPTGRAALAVRRHSSVQAVRQPISRSLPLRVSLLAPRSDPASILAISPAAAAGKRAAFFPHARVGAAFARSTSSSSASRNVSIPVNLRAFSWSRQSSASSIRNSPPVEHATVAFLPSCSKLTGRLGSESLRVRTKSRPLGQRQLRSEGVGP